MREAGGLVRPHHRHSAPQAQQGRTRCVQEGLAATRVEVCAVEDPLPPGKWILQSNRAEYDRVVLQVSKLKYLKDVLL